MHDTSAVMPVSLGLRAALYDNAAFFGDRIRVVAFGRPYDYKEQDWTLRDLQEPDSGRQVDCSATRHLPEIAKDLDISEIFAPVPDFGAKICYPEDLNVVIPVADRLVLRRGVKADGCRLSLGQTYAISMAGCSVIVAWYPIDPRPGEKRRVVVAHAGFDSLFDRQAALTELVSRKRESVTESILDALGCWRKPARRKRVGAAILFPIASSDFRYPWKHPEFGEDNKAICDYVKIKWGKGCRPGEESEGRIDIGEIATAQLVSFGVPVEHIALIRTLDTFDHFRHSDKTPMWYTTRGPFKERRNLVMVQWYRR